MRSCKMSTLSIFTILFALIIPALPGSIIASDDILDHGTSLNVKKINQSLFMTAEILSQQIKQGRDITLVDIRSAEEFNHARIPGSINIPLHFIRTKMFLKQTDVVLITDGYQYNRLENECRKLEELDFKVSILSGGLNCWKQIDGHLEGDMWAHARFDMLTPHAFNLEKDYEHWVVIDVSMDNSIKDVMPDAVSLPVAEDQPLTLKRIEKSIKKQEEPCCLLFVSEQGRDYENIERIVRKTKLKNVFFLEGGAAAYREFLDGTSLSHKPKDQRMQEIKKCPTCG